MSKQVPWNKIILNEFIDLASLSDDEEQIMRMRIAGKSRLQIADALGMSTTSLDRFIARLKIKYDNVQPYSQNMPKRRFSAFETYSK